MALRFVIVIFVQPIGIVQEDLGLTVMVLRAETPFPNKLSIVFPVFTEVVPVATPAIAICMPWLMVYEEAVFGVRL